MDVYKKRHITAANCNELMQVTANARQVKENDVREGDIFFTPSSETAEDIGHVKVIDEDLPNTVYSYHLMRFRKNEDSGLDKKFPEFALETDFVRKQMYLAAQGAQRFVISKPAFEELLMLVPSISEQQKIGDFFAALDELIGAKEEELEKLRQLKQALLQQMFPANTDDNLAGGRGGNSQITSLLQGSNLTIYTAPNTPRIRFKGFTEPWQKKTFGDYGYISMCKRVMKYQTSVKGEIPFFKIGTFGGEPDAYISRELFTQLKNNYQYPEEGDILISAAGTLGRAVVFNGKDQYFQDSNIVWLNHKGKIYNPFLKLLYGVVKWNSVEGSTLKRLYNSNILNSEIYVPEYKEQQMIGDFFREQDEQINAAQQQIKKLTIIKQALLQKMFAA